SRSSRRRRATTRTISAGRPTTAAASTGTTARRATGAEAIGGVQEQALSPWRYRAMNTLIVENEAAPRSAIAWPGVLAGAAIATALSLALLALGAGLGFSVASPWTADRILPETTKAATVAGIYLTVTAVLASAVGGYIAGRLRTLWPGVPHHEAFFRDTVHGVAAW